MHASLERLRKRREEEGDEGFTLIELLIVIVILGILAAIVVFAVQNLSSSSSQASCGSDYKTVQTAVEAYKAQMGSYPNGAGTAATDTESETVPAESPDYAPGGAAFTPGSFVNAALSVTVGGVTNGGELLVDSATPPNHLAVPPPNPVGPWLKSAPTNPNHYTIFVPNDGSGTVVVLNGANVFVGDTAGACSSAS